LAGITSGQLTNPWVPAALVSFFFPGLGHLFLPRPDLKAIGVKIFVAYLVIMIGVPVLFGILGSITGVYQLGYVWSLFNLLRLIAHPLSLFHTHDTACKLNPQLGSPILFKK